MEMRKIVVPEGMIKAAIGRFRFLVPEGEHHWRQNECDRQCKLCGAIDCSSAGDYSCPGVPLSQVGLTLEPALRWLSENPQSLIDDVQLAEINKEWWAKSEEERNGTHFYRWALNEMVRRMFLAPVEEIPEAIRDLLWADPRYPDGTWYTPIDESKPYTDQTLHHNKSILEAFRRGKESR